MLAERERLERERILHELNLQQRQLTYLLDRCNSFATQATLVTGFAFTAFSADALQSLSFQYTPVRSFLFVITGAITMALSISVVGVSSFLTGQAERLAMEVDVRTAVALVRHRMRWILWPFYASLFFLWSSAALLVFATCTAQNSRDPTQWDDFDFQLCDTSGWVVVLVFVVLGGALSAYPRWAIWKDVRMAYSSESGLTARSEYHHNPREPLR